MARRLEDIQRVIPKIGLEVHVELATRSKMFTRVGNPACPEFEDSEPNTLIDPVVLALPGALPVPNRAAVEMSVRVGLALGCQIATLTKWDRKSYFYPDLPKAYQISQYDLPVCGDGAIDIPVHDPKSDEVRTKRVGIIRAHLEEDAGKLLHEWPGGGRIDFSIVDLNRAGTPLLEIVTAPDFDNADDVVAFAQALRNLCRALGVTEGVMQKGHMRFEPNINATLELPGGHTVVTPIVEIKNLNSFRALRASIEHELREQPQRWVEDGREMGPGAKTTRGWDDQREVTLLQREKEDAHDYRYFPDPDLLPVEVDRAWVESIRSAMPELPHERAARYRRDYGLAWKETAALTEEPGVGELLDEAIQSCIERDIERDRGARLGANLVLQCLFRLANERSVAPGAMGIDAERLGGVIVLRASDRISANAAERLLEMLIEEPLTDPEVLAEREGLLQVRDDSALEAWVEEVLADPAMAASASDVRNGKTAAVGRLIGAVMQKSQGRADAARVREMLLERLHG
ncbi:MAG: Asp-tRNA(Asn)/Glu-tRNA(Gln) amidotransferase subunit GatB [Phycisphaeraceae bacterium]|nr:MAG: Asp-tRNA(Asn)/Glu-tRNA(Gln) amidotransferase subunit GatB [Phycisphaeraceae bacterium]